MIRSFSVLAVVTALAVPVASRAQGDSLATRLEAELAKFPARTGVYVKHLTTGAEVAIRADEPFSSASVIKIPIMIKAFQMVDAKQIDLAERVEIRRADLRDGSGVLQYHDLGLRPTIRDLITQMVITSDNTATDLMTLKVGDVPALNAWLEKSGYAKTRMVGRGFEYRRNLLALIDPAFATITPEETTGLQYAVANNPLFDLYGTLFTGPKAKWVEIVRDPANRRKLAERRDALTVEDRAYWLGSMTPRETGRLLESIERNTAASPASCELMKTTLRRQQAGARRLPHYLEVPVAHKTGDSAVIANDVGIIYARTGPIVVAFFVNGIRGQIGETEDLIGRAAQTIVRHFDGASR